VSPNSLGSENEPSAVNILFIEQQPRFIGGSERMSLSLCTQMRRDGHSTHLLYEAEGDMVGAFREVTDSCTRAPVVPIALRRPSAALASLRHLRRAIRTHAIDVLFTSHLGYVPLLAAERFLGGTPSLIHIGLGDTPQTRLYKWAMPRVGAIVTPSEHMRAICAAAGWPSASLKVIPNGVDLERFKPVPERAALRLDLGLDPDLPLVVYMGRIVREKGVFCLVEAAAILKRRGMAFHLVLIGAAPGKEAVELTAAAAAAGLGPDTFSLRGPTDRPERFLAAADIVVVPTQGPESFGLAAVEAMACSTTTIVSDAGILPQIVGIENERCWFVQGDAEGLANRLEFFLGHPAERVATGASLLAKVMRHYSLVQCAAAYEKELRRCMEPV